MELNERIKNYWEGEATLYSRSIEEELKGPQRAAWQHLILDNAPAKEGLEILDIGTGPGFFPIILTEAGHHVTGIDITENMIKCAKENVRQAGVEATLLQMDCQALTFADNRFDLVICRNLTWTLNDPVTAYKEWFRVLRPGGRLLVFDACWYLHLFDEERRVKFEENEARIWKKYDRRAHSHADQEEGDKISKQLFMSDKYRPLWDVGMMIDIGFSKIFSTIDITGLVWDEVGKELNKTTPAFMVGGEK
ncbi:MAG: ubiquinone/menaquinone biosynthesis methyltransferase [Sporomusa sp.]|jgi:SAM-dependent methyltransferase|nr:ubiquinone/menaquinone biosynthesis methyltransferase [Sporomusa sp.]